LGLQVKRGFLFSKIAQAITVTDFDECETTLTYVISSTSGLAETGISVFPNPTSGEVQIDLGPLQGQATISVIDIHRRILQSAAAADKLNAYQLPDTQGIYFLVITFSDGSYHSAKMVKL
jgi:hypothetical protein